MFACKKFSAAIFVFLYMVVFSSGMSSAKDLYVSLSGNDSWSGNLPKPNINKTDGPFRTLEKARDTIRQLKQKQGLPAGGLKVYIRGGIYTVSSQFTLTKDDSGTEKAPVVYAVYPGEEAHFLGGKIIIGFKPVDNDSILSRFQKSARGKIFQADLKANGITDYGAITQNDGPQIDFYFKSKPMTLTRYPDEGWLTIFSVPLDCKKPFVGDPRELKPDGTSKGMHCGKFVYSDITAEPEKQVTRPDNWAPDNDIWMLGYWYWDWASMYQKIEKIDTKNKLIYFTPPYHFYGYRAGQKYYFLNVLEELNSPGKWHLDRKNGILYFWPPEPIDSGQAFISSMKEIMIYLNNTSYVTVKGILFEGSRQTAVAVEGGTHNIIDGCTIRNFGGHVASEISGGTENGIINCTIHDIAGGGINLSGGDRLTLIPGKNYAVNNHIYNYAKVYTTYHPGISLSGVGNIVSHNLIHNSTNLGISLSGNEHIIEYNEIHDMALQTTDAGGIYIGRDWTQRGTIIRYNFFYNIVKSPMVSFDDFASGNTVFGNVFYKAIIGVSISGGRDITVENNIFIECNPGVDVDGRGLHWASYYFDKSLPNYDNTLFSRMDDVNYSKPPYSTKYPELLTLYSDEPATPKNNKIIRNIFYRSNNLTIEKIIEKYITPENNLDGIDPLFTDYGKMNFQLKDNSPAYSKIGFKKIPFEKIGLIKKPFDVNVNANN